MFAKYFQISSEVEALDNCGRWEKARVTAVENALFAGRSAIIDGPMMAIHESAE